MIGGLVSCSRAPQLWVTTWVGLGNAFRVWGVLGGGLPLGSRLIATTAHITVDHHNMPIHVLRTCFVKPLAIFLWLP